MSASKRYIESLQRDYAAESDDPLLRRLVGWKCSADATVLLFTILSKVKAIRAALEAQAQKERR